MAGLTQATFARPSLSLDDLLRDVPREKLSQGCTDEDFAEIARCITEWQFIAPYLGLSEVNEEEITCKYPNKLIMQKIGMLRKWRERIGFRAATYQKLVESFWRSGKITLVEHVCSLLVSPKTKNAMPEDLSGSSSTIDPIPPPAKRSRIGSSNNLKIELKELVEDIPQDDFLVRDSSGPLHVVRGQTLPIRFSGPLVTSRFQKIDRAFYRAIHACKADDIEWATEKMLSLEVSTDWKAVTLLYRASCRAVVRGQMDEALLDCDKAIEKAMPLESPNGSLLIGRALRQKTAILRSLGKYDEAKECATGAKVKYFLAAPSSDTAALLYEDVRLKIQIALSKGVVINFSEVVNDYDLILQHSECLDDHDRSRLCIFLNAQAEVLLRSYYVKEELPPTDIAPTQDDLSRAECLLNSVPLKELPEEGYVYRAWHYLARSDLCMWRKQYPKAIEWAEKSQDHFTRGKVVHVNKPQERIELLKKLQAQEIQETKELDEIVDQLSA